MAPHCLRIFRPCWRFGGKFWPGHWLMWAQQQQASLDLCWLLAPEIQLIHRFLFRTSDLMRVFFMISVQKEPCITLNIGRYLYTFVYQPTFFEVSLTLTPFSLHTAEHLLHNTCIKNVFKLIHNHNKLFFQNLPYL